MKKNHSEPIAPGHMGKEHDHHVEQTHKTHGGDRKNDGAGRHGHDESGHRAHSEHKAPTHPEGGQAKVNHAPGAFGYPGKVMHMDHEHQLIGGDYKQSDHEPAILKHQTGPNGWDGMHTGLGTAPHGFGHQKSQKSGNLRLSGHPGSHQIGKRK